MKNPLIVDQVATLQLLPEILKEAQEGNQPSWRFKTILQRADTTNGNGRKYPKDILMRESKRYQEEKIDNKYSYGELDHPDSDIVKFSNACLTVESLDWDGNDLCGVIEILDTPAGNIIRNILKAGKRVGISSRGMGTVKQLGEIVEVNDDFEVVAWDIVTIPSTQKADFKYENLTEGKTNQTKYKWSKVNELINKLIIS